MAGIDFPFPSLNLGGRPQEQGTWLQSARIWMKTQLATRRHQESMGKAFEAACKALNVFADDEQGRRVTATGIIDLARGGLTDAEALAERVIAEGKLSI